MGVVEPGGINEHDSLLIQYELLRFLNLGCARLEVIPGFKTGPADLVHELGLNSMSARENQWGSSSLYRCLPASGNTHYTET